MSSYKESGRIKDMAGKLIKKHHAHLEGVPIAYVLKEGEVGKKIVETLKGKKATIVKARKQSELNLYLTGYDFVVETNERLWDLLSVEAQEACLDTALCHMKHDSEKGFYLMDTPIQTFPEIVERHGLWNQDLKEMSKQMLLFDGLLTKPKTKAPVKPPGTTNKPESSVVN